MGISFLVGSSLFLLVVAQQLVVILVIGGELMSFYSTILSPIERELTGKEKVTRPN